MATAPAPQDVAEQRPRPRLVKPDHLARIRELEAEVERLKQAVRDAKAAGMNLSLSPKAKASALMIGGPALESLRDKVIDHLEMQRRYPEGRKHGLHAELVLDIGHGSDKARVKLRIEETFTENP